ncbi:hypothetical protein BD770DRAFT_416759 [Pilaira anomala]|nr:hypothetical protein BD770DRAFT_416759 [Pilaira anomala]
MFIIVDFGEKIAHFRNIHCKDEEQASLKNKFSANSDNLFCTYSYHLQADNVALSSKNILWLKFSRWRGSFLSMLFALRHKSFQRYGPAPLQCLHDNLKRRKSCCCCRLYRYSALIRVCLRLTFVVAGTYRESFYFREICRAVDQVRCEIPVSEAGGGAEVVLVVEDVVTGDLKVNEDNINLVGLVDETEVKDLRE